jgi:hypothetical protein
MQFSSCRLSENALQNKKPAGANGASGPMSACFSESLYAPRKPPRQAVMVLVAMRSGCERCIHLENQQ